MVVFLSCDPTRQSPPFWVLSVVLIFFSFQRSLLVLGEPNSNSGFVDSDHDLLAVASNTQDLLAVPSEPHSQFRAGPVTSYAFDSVAVESQNNGQGSATVVVAPPPSQQSQDRGSQAEGSSQRSRRRKPVVTVAPTDHQQQVHHEQPQLQQQQQQFLPIITHEQPQQYQPLYFTSPSITAPVIPLTTGYIPQAQYVEEQPHIYYEDPSYHQQYLPQQQFDVAQVVANSDLAHVGPMEIYKDIIAHPHKLISYFTTLVAQFKVPKQHYINVVSFVGVYLLMSYLFYGSQDILQLTCEVTTKNKGSRKEWSYHAGRRYVAALPVDRKMQLEFLQLFQGSRLEDENSGSSSEEDFSGELSHIDELCPKGAFFYSLSPVHIEAWTQLQRLFVAQPNPAGVLSLAKDLLYKQKVHPKIWYLGLIAAAIERPDMTGFTLAHPVDAMPDWFIPADLIKDDMDRYRALGVHKRVKRRIETIALVPRNATNFRMPKLSSTSSATTSSTTTTTQRPLPDSAEISGEFIGLDGSVIDNKNAKSISEPVADDTKLTEYKYRQTASGQGRQQGGHKQHNRHKGDKGGHKHKHSHKHGKGKGKGKGHDKEEEDHCIRVDGRIGRDNGIENKLWWWHQTFPLNATRHPDRRAELFFFMHRSFLARYNAERLSNGLHRSYELDFQPGGIVHEGYNSHLADVQSGKYWFPRPPKQPLTDIIHLDDPNFSRNIIIPEMLGIYNRLVKGIKTGKLVGQNGQKVSIWNAFGMDPLRNTVEATSISVNPLYYDTFGIHNYGHMMIAWMTDPFFKLHAPPGIMAEQAMSMRDPAFYPYHIWLDNNIFERFKQTLAPYQAIGGDFPLLWRGIEVQHVELISKSSEAPNQLKTFWTERRFQLQPGVDGSVGEIAEEEHANVCATHLAHEPFIYKIVVERKHCAKTKSGKGTIRIFMAPRYDEKGRRFHLKEQRRLMFQVDAFQVKLRVGKNIITRRSHDSSLTKPWSTSLKEAMVREEDGAADFCGCGWPQHLYIPKGNKVGMPFDLFVMATNYDEDRVQDSPEDLKFPEPCNSPYIFCGHPMRRYPDARPMGYPFDRPMFKPPIPCHPGHSFSSILCQNFNLVFHKPIDTLEQYVRKAPNMKSTVFEIKHIDHFVKDFHHQRQSENENNSNESNEIHVQPSHYQKPRHLGGFTIKDDAEDLLALPSDTNSAPAVVAPIDRNGPITTYAQQHTDNKAEESFGGGVISVVPPSSHNGNRCWNSNYQGSQGGGGSINYQNPQGGGGNVNYQNPQGYQNQQQYQQQYQPPQRPTVLHPRPLGQSQNSQQISASASVQYPQAQLLQQQSQQQFSTIYQQPQQLQNLPNIHQPIMAQFSNPQVVAYSPGVGVGYHTALLDNNVPLFASGSETAVHHDQKVLGALGSEAELYKAAIKNPLHLIDSVLKFFKQFAVPKEHYLNTISFAGIYLLCLSFFMDLKISCKVDGKLQKKFLKLFEGMHLDDDGGDGSSSEEMSAELAGVNEVCPRGHFFYSLSPMHLEARMQIQRLFVAQKSPLDVYLLAKDLLYKHKIHPKIWYLGLVAAALERDDMTGFKVLVLPLPESLESGSVEFVLDGAPKRQTQNDLIYDEDAINNSIRNYNYGNDGGEGGDGGNGGGDSSEEDHECIVVGGKHGEDNGIENKLWYFREDMMLSQHHWYWHLTHPVNATKHPDRRAELFFFTHRNFLARQWPLNQLRTFWTKKKFELAPSVDKSTDQGGDAHICAVHLAHEPFTFKITIERKSCAKSKSGKGTIRIFMAPRFDEKGRRLHLKEQRRVYIMHVSIAVRVGRNIITRRSHDSSLTKPWTKSLRDYEHADPTGAADFCGCGYHNIWKHQGMPFDLFVMVTNYDEDHVPNHPKDLEIPETCNSPYIFCGLPKRRYPDARPMGYPWDRPPYKTPIPCLLVTLLPVQFARASI
ncbi:Hemocyanin E chain [Orchesella cincta]|uniref:Hemocyanin E chain n=1 Tax=Orchesella cincta TaxID=48709 RepID=A0A1D2N868_ORCCI|nr:Hemocyanin E chain [Orchesella cincta]